MHSYINSSILYILLVLMSITKKKRKKKRVKEKAKKESYAQHSIFLSINKIKKT